MDEVTKARENYASAMRILNAARDAASKARHELERLEGKARTPEQRDKARIASRRQQLLKSRPDLLRLVPRARRQALDALIAAKDAPRVWKFYLDDMNYDRETRTLTPRSVNLERFRLYKAGVQLGATMLRRESQASTDGAERQRLRDNARTLELHLQSLVDVSPREVRVLYPSEWRVISSALRPEGSSPRSKGAMRLFALYQHIIRTHREEDA